MSYEQQQISRLLNRIEKLSKEVEGNEIFIEGVIKENSKLQANFNLAYHALRDAYNYSNEGRVKGICARALEKLDEELEKAKNGHQVKV